MTYNTDVERNKQLERIADALEAMLPVLEKIANPPMLINLPPSPNQSPPASWPNGGYRCARCGTWIMSGTAHACSGLGIGGSATAKSPPHTTTWNVCDNGVSFFPLAGTAVGDTFS